MNPGRREVLCLVLALFPGRIAAQAPPAAKVYRIGWLGTAHTDSEWDRFIEGLRELGWIEGKNLAFERLYSGGRSGRFPALAAQLVQRNVDLIVGRSHAAGRGCPGCHHDDSDPVLLRG